MFCLDGSLGSASREWETMSTGRRRIKETEEEETEEGREEEEEEQMEEREEKEMKTGRRMEDGKERSEERR